MHVNLKHIAEGWAKSLGLWEVTEEMKALSLKRMEICAACPFAKESTFFKLARGSVNKIDALTCSICKCPINEKTLVEVGTCPENKW